MAASHFVLLALLALQGSMLAIASDPSPLQDFCVADNASPVFVNGLPCKDPKLAKSQDFFFPGFDKTTISPNPQVPGTLVARIPGLNTLGISQARLDFLPGVVNPPHYHPRATEIFTVLRGMLYVGFIASDSRLFTMYLKKGDVFVFPQGLMHFQLNHGSNNASALAVLTSQNPGVISVPSAIFGSKPSISETVLAKAFLLDKQTIERLQATF